MSVSAATRSMAGSRELAERADQLMPGPHSNLPGYELFRPIWLTHGKGAHLWDVDGNEYLDYMSGLGAGILGYGNPALLGAVRNQLERMPHLDAARRHPEEILLAEKIVAHVPSAEKVRYLLSGTEAVQLVLRLARAYTRPQPVHPVRRPLPRLARQRLRGRARPRPAGPAVCPLSGRRPVQLEGPGRRLREAIVQAALERH